MIFKSLLRWLKATLTPARKISIIVGDSLPKDLPRRNLVLCRDGDEDWSVGFRCPCGCGRRIELLLIEEAKPRWDVSVDKRARPTLTPSVWLKDGCCSHFWVRGGKIDWC
ncbi:DUF6527 family protein [Caballeronia sp. GACF4]|uniref:DUF6527 family protein n=1 Tax=Caballeronia sp. GACF4 TaxID=2921763 RepID=UPI002028CF5A|nr:DUF6527 family protein [Caballeronia sp. GACF4]